MIYMTRRLLSNKGAVHIAIIIAIVAVVAAVIIGIATNGFGLGGGKGDGEGEGNVSEAGTEQATEVSEPVVEEVDFLNVTVSENEYLYQNSRLQLDELMDKLVVDAVNTKVKITDENASKRAYNNLIDALEEKNISYIKADV